MKYDPISRRHFLQGLGGFALTIPFLPSLVREAVAQSLNVPPSLVMLRTGLGGLNDHNVRPDSARVQEQTFNIRPGWDMHYSALPTSICPSLGPNFDSLRPKMNLLTGLDVPQVMGHNSWGIGGNFYGIGQNESANYVPTIDQVLADSAKVYSSSPVARSLILSPSSSESWSLRADKNGKILPVPATMTPQSTFDALFGPRPNVSVVQSVNEDYQRLLSNPRLGATDRQRLNEHMDFIRDYETRLGVVTSCNSGTRPPATSVWPVQEPVLNNSYKLFNDLIITAFRCGITRVVSLSHAYTAPFGEDWHAHSHSWDTQNSQDYILSVMRWFADNVFYDLINKMNQVTLADQSTLLDRSFVMWTDENRVPHFNYDSRVITAGSLGGKLLPGYWFDFSNRTSPYNTLSTKAGLASAKPGQLYHRLLVTILQGMGLAPADYEKAREGVFRYGGYGQIWDGTGWGDSVKTLLANHYPLADTDKPLPVFWRG